MARVRMVTRTVEVTTVGCMCLDTLTCEVSIQNFDITGKVEDFNVALKMVKKEHETNTFKCVAIQHCVTKEVLYGMTELDFIKLAKVLPPRSGQNEEC